MALIPREFRFIWIQGEAALPPKFAFNVGTWRQKNPGYGTHVHGGEEIEALVKENFPALLPLYARLAIVNKKDVGMFALLHAYGGVFMDLDMQCARGGLEEVLKEQSLVAVDHGNRGLCLKTPRASLVFAASIPGHPAVEETLRAMSTLPFRSSNFSMSKLLYTCWADTFRDMQNQLVSTPLQMYILPTSVLGLDKPEKYTSTTLLLPDKELAVLSRPQGSWHSPISSAYHTAVYSASMNTNTIKFSVLLIFAVLNIAFMIAVLVLLVRRPGGRR